VVFRVQGSVFVQTTDYLWVIALNSKPALRTSESRYAICARGCDPLHLLLSSHLLSQPRAVPSIPLHTSRRMEDIDDLNLVSTNAIYDSVRLLD
jgi:hypothetical protein